MFYPQQHNSFAYVVLEDVKQDLAMYWALG